MSSSSSVPGPSYDGSPRRALGASPRPSLARTSISTQATERTTSASISHAGWESTDIRGDLALGWGDTVARGGGANGRAASAQGSARDAAGDSGHDHDVARGEDWGWKLHDQAVRPVPPFYPMDPRSTRRIRLARSDARPPPRAEGEEGGEAGKEEEMKTSEGAIMERISPIHEISHRISKACQSLSVYGIWDNMCPSATLSSMERVEMEITIYLDGTASAVPQVVLVELQRRKGCSITFHNYRRCLLDAAEGKFNTEAFKARDGSEKGGRDRTNQPRASLKRPGLARPGLGRPSPSAVGRPSLARPTLSPPSSPGLCLPPPLGRPSPARPAPARPPALYAHSLPGDACRGDAVRGQPPPRAPAFSADSAAAPLAGLKTAEEDAGRAGEDSVVEKALKALNMAASLIKKDRVDARTLGMESLVLLTDPSRAGADTAKIASRVVLLGSAYADGGAGGSKDDVDALFDESAGLGIRETILEMIMTDAAGEERMVAEGDASLIEKEFTDSLFNLCLTVLSNALIVMGEEPYAGAVGAAPRKGAPAGKEDRGDASAVPPNDQCGEEDDGNDVDEDRKHPPSASPNRRRAATEPAVRPPGVSKRFIDDTNSTFGGDVLSSLIRILGQARTHPHDAYHSARCLGVLFRGCGGAHKARARKDLDAKRIIAMALEVGSRSHAKLEDASRVAMMALVTDDEGSVAEEEAGATDIENDTAETEVDTSETVNERLREGTAVEQQELDEMPTAMEQSMSGDSDERW